MVNSKRLILGLSLMWITGGDVVAAGRPSPAAQIARTTVYMALGGALLAHLIGKKPLAGFFVKLGAVGMLGALLTIGARK